MRGFLGCLAAMFLWPVCSYGAEPKAAVDPFFVVVGGRSTKGPDGKLLREMEFGNVAVSADGKNWDIVFDGGPIKDQFNHGHNNLYRGMAYGNGRFVVVGNPGTLYSDDGRTWRIGAKPEEKIGGFCAAFGDGMFMIGRAADFAVSKDGVTWQKHSMYDELKKKYGLGVWGKEGAGHVRKIVYGHGVFVVTGERRLGATRDGKSFVHHEVLPVGEKYGQQELMFGAGRFILLSERGHRTSTDGVKWEPLTIESRDAEIVKRQTQGVWTGDRFIVTGKEALHVSTDGLTWRKIESKGWPRVRVAAGDLILAHRGWSKDFSASTDGGKTWQTWKPKQTIGMRQMYYFDGKRLQGTGGG